MPVYPQNERMAKEGESGQEGSGSRDLAQTGPDCFVSLVSIIMRFLLSRGHVIFCLPGTRLSSLKNTALNSSAVDGNHTPDILCV